LYTRASIVDTVIPGQPQSVVTDSCVRATHCLFKTDSADERVKTEGGHSLVSFVGKHSR